jgi:NADPH2:quinone reductase
MRSVVADTPGGELVDSGALRVPEGQSIPVEKFSDAVLLAEAPAHGGKPLLVF